MAVAGTPIDVRRVRRCRPKPLAGRVVVIDPGHQLGNHNFPRRIHRPVPAGGFTKPCNTTGTATNGGYPEATFAWQVSRLVAARLRELGATVRLTRQSNRQDRWGPCVDVRGRAGNATPRARRRPQAVGPRRRVVRRRRTRLPRHRPARPGAVDRRHPPAVDAAGDLGEGRRCCPQRFGVATYTAGGDGIDVRSDLGTLNLSDVPTVMVELGNMRSASEARVMTSPAGRARYARGLVTGVRRFLG